MRRPDFAYCNKALVSKTNAAYSRRPDFAYYNKARRHHFLRSLALQRFFTPPPPPHISLHNKKRHKSSVLSKLSTFSLDALPLIGFRFITLTALSASLAFAHCDSGGAANDGNEDKPSVCVDNQILKSGQCEACVAPQYPNSDRTACVSKCADGEIKPDNKPACEAMLSCADPQVYDPASNTCTVESGCGADRLIDTTLSPRACITPSDCRSATGKFVNAADSACISQSACTSVAGQVATVRGDCETCAGNTSIRNMEKTQCISAMACTSVSNQVATTRGDCEACTGMDSIRNMEKTQCMSAQDCQSLSAGAFSVLDDADCITDAACIAEDGRVATTDGVCKTCTGTDSIRNMEKTACMSAQDCQSLSAGAFSVLNEAECITDTACIAEDDRVATHRRRL